MKASVIARLRQADQWLATNGGEPLRWVRALFNDAAQELEAQSGSLWMQWTTRDGNIRLFVAGDLTVEDLDTFMEALTLSRDSLRRRGQRRESATAVDAVDPVDGASNV